MLTISYTANLSHRQQVSLPFPWIPQLCVPQLWQPLADLYSPDQKVKALEKWQQQKKYRILYGWILTILTKLGTKL